MLLDDLLHQGQRLLALNPLVPLARFPFQCVEDIHVEPPQVSREQPEEFGTDLAIKLSC